MVCFCVLNCVSSLIIKGVKYMYGCVAGDGLQEVHVLAVWRPLT